MEILGCVLGIDLCKLDVNKLPKANENVVLKALLNDVQIATNCPETNTMDRESLIGTSIVAESKPYNWKLLRRKKSSIAAQSKATMKSKVPLKAAQ